MLPTGELEQVVWIDEPDGAGWIHWLHFPDYVVGIEGSGLAALKDGLQAGEIDWIQGYDPAR